MYLEIAEEEEIPKHIMHNVNYHFFRFIKDIIANSSGEIIHVQGFGKFKPSKRVINAMIKAYEANPEKYKEELINLKKIGESI